MLAWEAEEESTTLIYFTSRWAIVVVEWAEDDIVRIYFWFDCDSRPIDNSFNLLLWVGTSRVPSIPIMHSDFLFPKYVAYSVNVNSKYSFILLYCIVNCGSMSSLGTYPNSRICSVFSLSTSSRILPMAASSLMIPSTVKVLIGLWCKCSTYYYN